MPRAALIHQNSPPNIWFIARIAIALMALAPISPIKAEPVAGEKIGILIMHGKGGTKRLISSLGRALEDADTKASGRLQIRATKRRSGIFDLFGRYQTFFRCLMPCRDQPVSGLWSHLCYH